ncbi:MAG: ABC transporter permease [Armatimonadota bacterium]|nr:ABC transporter permease [Armatimonadota bacterium]
MTSSGTPSPSQNTQNMDDFSGGMPIWESTRVAWRGLTSNKMRTGLTMLGIIIGVGAVIAMVSMGKAASKSVAASINQLGTNLLAIYSSGAKPRVGTGQGGAPLKLEDSKAIEDRFKQTIRATAPQIRGNVTVKMTDQEATTQVVGTTPSYEGVNNTPVQSGRYFTEQEVNGRSKVALVGKTVLTNVLGDSQEDPVGKMIAINRVPFQIIGVLATKGSGAFGQDQDDIILVPITTAMRRVFNKDNINMIGVECVSPQTMDLATEQISGLLRQRHHLLPPFPANDDFAVRSQSSLLQTSQGVTGTLTSLLAGVAVVSLVVGGIGIMNIMLVSVTERTREIGLRKAVGATSNDILMQFMIEALVMSLIGGLIGIILGIGASVVVGSKMGWGTVIDPTILIIAVAVSGSIGVIFGIYPAAKAAAQSPIDALRYE